MQEEVTQKTIALSMKTGKLTAQALQAALKKYLQHRAKGPKLHHGKQSLKQLKAHGAALTNIEVTEANIGAFKPCAKKYGVDFTLRKDKTTQPPHYIVIFKAKDAETANSLKEKCTGTTTVCTSVKREKKTVQPPKLYDLTTLQREANRLFGFTAKQTLDYGRHFRRKACRRSMVQLHQEEATRTRKLKVQNADPLHFALSHFHYTDHRPMC